MPHRVLYRRVGLRGEALILFGVIWILLGTGIPLRENNDPVAGLWHTLLPVPVQIAMWVVPGIVAALSARTRSNWGLASMVIAPTVRGLSYLWAWVVWIITDGADGARLGWYSAVFYLLMVAIVFLLAHIPAGLTPPPKGGSE